MMKGCGTFCRGSILVLVILIVLYFAVSSFVVHKKETFSTRQDGLSSSDLIISAFNTILFRNPTPDEILMFDKFATDAHLLNEEVTKLKSFVTSETSLTDSLKLEDRLDIYKIITDVYDSTLHRLPSMKELNYYMQLLVSEDFTDVDLKTLLVASSEYVLEDPIQLYYKPVFGTTAVEPMYTFLKDKFVELNKSGERFTAYLMALNASGVSAESKPVESETSPVHVSYSPMDPNYYDKPIDTKAMDVFWETSKCVQKTTNQPIPSALTGIAINEYQQPLAKYSNDRNMNELMGNIARNTYYLNHEPDHKDQIVQQPVILPSNMSGNLVTDMSSFLGDSMQTSEYGAVL